jgi:predicted ATPase
MKLYQPFRTISVEQRLQRDLRCGRSRSQRVKSRAGMDAEVFAPALVVWWAQEAATDVIAAAQTQGTVQPWTHPSFIVVIANLQRDRQIRASYQRDEVQFHDRCAVCTAALAVYLRHPFSPFLASELQRLQKEAIYQNRVFFIRNLGFITPTEARRISFEETVRFEKIHEETYRDFGFELVSVGPGSLVERVSIIKAAIR